jgi:hypothetical protein
MKLHIGWHFRLYCHRGAIILFHILETLKPIFYPIIIIVLFFVIIMLRVITSIITMLGFVILTASSSMPHDINSTDEVLLASPGYNNSYSVGNVQTLHETRSEMEIPIDENGVNGVDEQHVVEAHLENLWKQRSAWKLHYHNSIT